MALRLIFMGTPEFSVEVLKKLLGAGYDICAVYSQPPRKSGRGMKQHPSPVHAFAEQNHIRVLTPTSLNQPDAQREFADFNADAAVVVAYGLLLPQAILDAPKYGCFNVHASLLPRWRGAAPIQRAIMAGDEKSGVTIMQMEAGLDTGPMCLTAETPITEATTGQSLHDALSELGAGLMVEALAQLQSGSLVLTPQPETGVTYARKIDKAEARIDFGQPAMRVVRHIHGLSPFPGSWFELPVNGKAMRVKVLAAEVVPENGTAGEVIDSQLTIACSEGAIRPLVLQRPGKGVMALADFLNGIAVVPGTKV
ncbi:Methionyl-tRNA formyltransferase [hydrothermal vent metagenome]|uniref:methionyl-tRNA formyltransferase n=1 Tax=hydrothermal vent metagenome TaxID=652676 RepID=A0A3B0RN13_9ZZZZ